MAENAETVEVAPLESINLIRERAILDAISAVNAQIKDKVKADPYVTSVVIDCITNSKILEEIVFRLCQAQVKVKLTKASLSSRASITVELVANNPLCQEAVAETVASVLTTIKEKVKADPFITQIFIDRITNAKLAEEVVARLIESNIKAKYVKAGYTTKAYISIDLELPANLVHAIPEAKKEEAKSENGNIEPATTQEIPTFVENIQT